MRDATPSRTAAFVAAARSYGAMLPADARLISDPFGARFATDGRLDVAPPAIAVRRFELLRRWVLYMQVRTRVLDDAMLSFVAGGGRQVVLLGAGYDARALRFAEALADSVVFEVDHPATQGHKRAVLDHDGMVVRAARYVPWNFERRPMTELSGALAEAGHDPTRPTLTIWEGVTMYLTELAIDASLRAIRGWSTPGSQLAFTYVSRALVEQRGLPLRLLRSMLSGLGEPWRFGWDPGELAPYLRLRGLDLAQDASVLDEAVRLLLAAHARGVGRLGQRLALATANERIATVSAG